MYPITKKVEFKEYKDVENLKAIETSEKVSNPKIFIIIGFMELSKTEEYKNYSHISEVGGLCKGKERKDISNN